MPLPVKYFHSGMQGAPQLTNDWGCMTALLDAVLINGFNLKTITSMTSAASIATVTISGGHLFEVGQVLLIAGADQSEYNGEVRVLATTTTTLTFAITGTPVSPATGTITIKAAPLGWELAFVGTNKRAYRSKNMLSNRPFLRVDDGCDPAWTTTYGKFAKVTMAQGMSDIDTFVGARAPFDPALPTKNEVGTGSGSTAYVGWYKWWYSVSSIWTPTTAHSGADLTNPNRSWVIVGDDRGFHLCNNMVNATITTTLGGKCFTDFESYRSADGFNTLLCAQENYTIASTALTSNDTNVGYTKHGTPNTGKVILRSYLQIGNPVNVNFVGLANSNGGQVVSGNSTGISWPNGPDYSLLLHPIQLKESTHLRGRVPGLFFIHNDFPSMVHLEKINNVAGYPGRTFLFVYTNATTGVDVGAPVAYDITGPWW